MVCDVIMETQQC